jgi:hypothetical protein
MRRLAPLFVGLALTLPIAIGSTFVAAQSEPDALINRFAPSSIHLLDDMVVDSPNAGINAAAGIAQANEVEPIEPDAKTLGCSDRSGTNVRVNQECTNTTRTDLLGRGQSQNETVVAVNPTDPDNLLFGQNDYRNGDGSCGFDYAFDGGKRFGDGLLPESFSAPGFVAPRHYWDASGDPVVAFDSDGFGYYACLQFNRGVTSDLGGDHSGIFVYRSADGGASWTFPGDPVVQDDGTGDVGLNDKEWMTVDASPDSPFQDTVYVTWSRFSADFSASVINESHSTDHGVTWSDPQPISGFDATLCPVNFSGAPAGTCDANQFSNVFTSPNGTVYVAFQNFNNAVEAEGDNHNQILIVKSTDGGETWSDPVKVADFYDLPDCFEYTGFDQFRACVPTAPLSGTSIFRATNYPSGAATDDDTVVIDFGSYINPHSNPTLGNCIPDGFSATTGLNLYVGVGEVGGCNNDILRSVSTDGASTFTGTTLPPDELEAVSEDGSVPTDQWWQWSAENPQTDQVVVVYYDRQYGDCQATGCMDITMRHSDGSFVRVTSDSMPPSNEFPDVNGFSTFMGDYTGLAIGSDGVAHPVWTDSRNPIFAYDPTAADPRVPVFAGFGADIYTASIKDK